MNTQLDTMIEALKAARERLETAKVAKAERLAQLMADPDLAILTDACNLHADEVNVCEVDIKMAAHAQYQATQDKNVHEKVKVKIFDVFKITDSARVLAWVKVNLADALVFDDKKVKNYATKIGAVDGTEIVQEPRVQIASEL